MADINRDPIQRLIQLVFSVEGAQDAARATSNVSAGLDRTARVADRTGKRFGGLSDIFESAADATEALALGTGVLKGALAALGVGDIQIFLQSYSKQLLASRVQFSKYGESIVDTEKRLLGLAEDFAFTREEVARLQSQFEQGFDFQAPDRMVQVFDTLREVAGENSEEIGRLLQGVQSVGQKVPIFQELFSTGIASRSEEIADNSIRLSKGLLAAAAVAGDISLDELKEQLGIVDQLEKARMLAEAGDQSALRAIKERTNELNDNVRTLNEFRKIWEDIRMIVATDLQPFFKSMVDMIKDGGDELLDMAALITKITMAGALAGSAVAAARIGPQLGKVVYGKGGGVAASAMANAASTVTQGRGGRGAASALSGLGTRLNPMYVVVLADASPGGGGSSYIGGGDGRRTRSGRRARINAIAARGGAGRLGAFSRIGSLGTLSGLGTATLIGGAGYLSGGISSSLFSNADQMERRSPDQLPSGFWDSYSGQTGNALGMGATLATGAATGALVGSFVPVIGTAIGAIVGTVGASLTLFGKQLDTVTETMKAADERFARQLRERYAQASSQEERNLINLEQQKFELVQQLELELGENASLYAGLLGKEGLIGGMLGTGILGAGADAGEVEAIEKRIEEVNNQITIAKRESRREAEKAAEALEDQEEYLTASSKVLIGFVSRLKLANSFVDLINRRVDATRKNFQALSDLASRTGQGLNINARFNVEGDLNELVAQQIREIDIRRDALSIVQDLQTTIGSLDIDIADPNQLREALKEEIKKIPKLGEELADEYAAQIGQIGSEVQIGDFQATVAQGLEAELRESQAAITESLLAVENQFEGAGRMASALTRRGAAELQLATNLAAGVAPSAEMRMEQVRNIQREIGITEQSMSALGRELEKSRQRMASATAAGNADQVIQERANQFALETRINELMAERTELMGQQADLTKVIRDGYIDAIAAMSTGAGMFTQIVITQDQNIGQLMAATDNAVVGMRSGAMARGLETSERFTPGGITSQGRRFGASDEVNELIKISNPLGAFMGIEEDMSSGINETGARIVETWQQEAGQFFSTIGASMSTQPYGLSEALMEAPADGAVQSYSNERETQRLMTEQMETTRAIREQNAPVVNVSPQINAPRYSNASSPQAFVSAISDQTLVISRIDSKISDIYSLLSTMSTMSANVSIDAVGRNTGGIVPGTSTSPNKDSVLVDATPGEFYMQREIVNRYGPDLFSRLNSGQISRDDARSVLMKENIEPTLYEDITPRDSFHASLIVEEAVKKYRNNPAEGVDVVDFYRQAHKEVTSNLRLVENSKYANLFDQTVSQLVSNTKQNVSVERLRDRIRREEKRLATREEVETTRKAVAIAEQQQLPAPIARGTEAQQSAEAAEIVRMSSVIDKTDLSSLWDGDSEKGRRFYRNYPNLWQQKLYNEPEYFQLEPLVEEARQENRHLTSNEYESVNRKYLSAERRLSNLSYLLPRQSSAQGDIADKRTMLYAEYKKIMDSKSLVSEEMKRFGTNPNPLLYEGADRQIAERISRETRERREQERLIRENEIVPDILGQPGPSVPSAIDVPGVEVSPSVNIEQMIKQANEQTDRALSPVRMSFLIDSMDLSALRNQEIVKTFYNNYSDLWNQKLYGEPEYFQLEPIIEEARQENRHLTSSEYERVTKKYSDAERRLTNLGYLMPRSSDIQREIEKKKTKLVTEHQAILNNETLVSEEMRKFGTNPNPLLFEGRDREIAEKISRETAERREQEKLTREIVPGVINPGAETLPAAEVPSVPSPRSELEKQATEARRAQQGRTILPDSVLGVDVPVQFRKMAQYDGEWFLNYDNAPNRETKKEFTQWRRDQVKTLNNWQEEVTNVMGQTIPARNTQERGEVIRQRNLWRNKIHEIIKRGKPVNRTVIDPDFEGPVKDVPSFTEELESIKNTREITTRTELTQSDANAAYEAMKEELETKKEVLGNRLKAWMQDMANMHTGALLEVETPEAKVAIVNLLEKFDRQTSQLFERIHMARSPETLDAMVPQLQEIGVRGLDGFENIVGPMGKDSAQIQQQIEKVIGDTGEVNQGIFSEANRSDNPIDVYMKYLRMPIPVPPQEILSSIAEKDGTITYEKIQTDPDGPASYQSHMRKRIAEAYSMPVNSIEEMHTQFNELRDIRTYLGDLALQANSGRISRQERDEARKISIESLANKLHFLSREDINVNTEAIDAQKNAISQLLREDSRDDALEGLFVYRIQKMEELFNQTSPVMVGLRQDILNKDKNAELDVPVNFPDTLLSFTEASYATGGIAKPRPGGQLARLAEAGKPEAVVPLPDGNSIPVTFQNIPDNISPTGDSNSVMNSIFTSMQNIMAGNSSVSGDFNSNMNSVSSSMQNTIAGDSSSTTTMFQNAFSSIVPGRGDPMLASIDSGVNNFFGSESAPPPQSTTSDSSLVLSAGDKKRIVDTIVNDLSNSMSRIVRTAESRVMNDLTSR